MSDTDDAPRSILSHEEQRVAEGLAAGLDPAEIAVERDADPAVVERAVERIREKTDRALATLADSPFTGEAVAALDPGTRRSLRAALADGDDDADPTEADPGPELTERSVDDTDGE